MVGEFALMASASNGRRGRVERGLYASQLELETWLCSRR